MKRNIYKTFMYTLCLAIFIASIYNILFANNASPKGMCVLIFIMTVFIGLSLLQIFKSLGVHINNVVLILIPSIIGIVCTIVGCLNLEHLPSVTYGISGLLIGIMLFLKEFVEDNLLKNKNKKND